MENITSGEKIRVTLKLSIFFIVLTFQVLIIFSFSLVSHFSPNFSTVYT